MIEAGLSLLRGGSAPGGKTQTATGPGQAQALSCAKVLAVPVGQRREVSLEETDTQPGNVAAMGTRVYGGVMDATDADSSIGAPETELPETLKSISAMGTRGVMDDKNARDAGDLCSDSSDASACASALGLQAAVQDFSRLCVYSDKIARMRLKNKAFLYWAWSLSPPGGLSGAAIDGQQNTPISRNGITSCISHLCNVLPPEPLVKYSIKHGSN